MTEELFRSDAYLRECTAVVTAVNENRVQLDKTVFYPEGGGQPGDTGWMISAGGSEIQIVDTQHHSSEGLVHVIGVDGSLPAIGQDVRLRIDWDRRYRLMRMHSCMHMLCSVVPASVTGGSIRDGQGRLDFDLPETINKTDLSERLNEVIRLNRAMTLEWITEESLAAQPELVRTMSVKPPAGTGTIRLVNFSGIDLQPCGGTHVAATGEIGRVRIKKIEKKGRQNRRVIVVFDDDGDLSS